MLETIASWQVYRDSTNAPIFAISSALRAADWPHIKALCAPRVSPFLYCVSIETMASLVWPCSNPALSINAMACGAGCVNFLPKSARACCSEHCPQLRDVSRPRSCKPVALTHTLPNWRMITFPCDRARAARRTAAPIKIGTIIFALLTHNSFSVTLV